MTTTENGIIATITAVTVDYSTLYDAILYVSSDKTRTTLHNVRASWENGVAKVEATDSYAAYSRELPEWRSDDPSGEMLIPADAIRKLPKPGKNQTAEVLVVRNCWTLTLTMSGLTIETEYPDTDFPNLANLWPTTYSVGPEGPLSLNPTLLARIAKMRGNASTGNGTNPTVKTQPMTLVHYGSPLKPVVWEVPYTRQTDNPAHILMMPMPRRSH